MTNNQANTPNPFAAFQLRQKSCGIWIWVLPRNENASLTALENAGTPPTFGLSPTPLAPIGGCGDGVTVKSVSQCGVSTAVGMKKSMNEPVTTFPVSPYQIPCPIALANASDNQPW